MLVSAAHLRASSQHYNVEESPAMVRKGDVLWLHGCSMNAINTTLSNPDLAASDAMIGAVMSLAVYEYFWGDDRSKNYQMHLKACRRMIAIRGGLDALHPTVSRVLRWMAKTVANLSDSSPDEEQSEVKYTTVFDENETATSLADPECVLAPKVLDYYCKLSEAQMSPLQLC